jgi:VCBS repeat-containing protein
VLYGIERVDGAAVSWIVTDNDAITNGNDGADTLTNIETISFAAGTPTSLVVANLIGSLSDNNSANNTVAENAINGSLVGFTANATGAGVTYSLTNNAEGRFTINSSTGVVSVTNASLLDYETAQSHNITVRALSTDGSFTQKSFSIVVTDVNEAPTAVVLTNTITDLDENSVVGEGGIKVADIAVTDDALGTNELSLNGDDASSFTIVNNELFFTGSAPDFESLASYSVNVVATDSSLEASVSETFTLAINGVNEAPIGPITGTLASSFEDTDYTISNSTLLSGFTDVDAGNTFSIANLASVNGTFIGNTFTPNLNYNGPATLSYDVIDGNGGSIAATRNFLINPIDDPTIITGDTTGTVTEDTAVIFSGSLVATDADISTSELFTPVADQNGDNNYGRFTILSNGAWQYNLDNSNPLVQHLGAANSLTDTYTFNTITGENQTVSVTINGSIDAGISIIGTSADEVINGKDGNDFLNGDDGQDSLIGGFGNDYLIGGNGNDTLEGEDGDDLLRDDQGDDYLIGGRGDDDLYAGVGNNTLEGGTGNDRYYISHNPTDTINSIIIEEAGAIGGIDTAYSSLTVDLLADNVENLVLLFDGTINATGNDLDNSIYGNSTNNIINGGNGNDYLNGRLGNDYLIGGDGNDTLEGEDGDDLLRDDQGDDYLIGGRGDDDLYAGIGNNTLEGGTGNDRYYISHNSTDTINSIIIEEAGAIGGIDTAYSSLTVDLLANNVENLVLLFDGTINATGNDLDNSIYGNSTNNIINGGNGNDYLNGRLGNDYLIGGDGNDTLEGEDGDDLLRDDQGDDYLIGGRGNDDLYAGVGNNTLEGGAGNDVYYISHNPTDTVNSTIIEEAGAIGGIDTAYSSLTVDLLADNVENLVLLFDGTINATGNDLDNYIVGNSASNVINGGAGADIIIGGAGADIFTFAFTESSAAAADRITDFEIGTDTIDLLSAPAGIAATPTSFIAITDNSSIDVSTLAQFAHSQLSSGGAALVSAGAGNIAGNTYLVIDDGNSGFGGGDLVIDITGYTGSLPTSAGVSSLFKTLSES